MHSYVSGYGLVTPVFTFGYSYSYTPFTHLRYVRFAFPFLHPGYGCFVAGLFTVAPFYFYTTHIFVRLPHALVYTHTPRFTFTCTAFVDYFCPTFTVLHTVTFAFWFGFARLRSHLPFTFGCTFLIPGCLRWLLPHPLYTHTFLVTRVCCLRFAAFLVTVLHVWLQLRFTLPFIVRFTFGRYLTFYTHVCSSFCVLLSCILRVFTVLPFTFCLCLYFVFTFCIAQLLRCLYPFCCYTVVGYRLHLPPLFVYTQFYLPV